MTRFSLVAAFLFAFSLFTSPAQAEERGTPAEAQALLEKAVVYVKENGVGNAQAFFADKANGFIDRDLYVTVIDLEGKSVVHAANPKIVGKVLIGLKDLDKKTFIKDVIDATKDGGSSAVDYKWSDPITKKIRSKTMFNTLVNDVIVSVGAYKQ